MPPEQSYGYLPACPNCKAPAGRLCIQPVGAPPEDYSGHCRARLDLLNVVDSTALEIPTAELPKRCSLSQSVSYADRAAINRDLIWALLWRLNQPGWPHEGWVTTRQVYDLWLDGRDKCGIAWAEDWIGPQSYFSYIIKRLVLDGRAERRKLSGRHPTYRAVLR